MILDFITQTYVQFSTENSANKSHKKMTCFPEILINQLVFEVINILSQSD